VICGIDFSMNSTGICKMHNGKYSFVNVYRNQIKKNLPTINKLGITLIHNENDNSQQSELSKIQDAVHTVDLIFDNIRDCEFVAIEGLAFGAKGSRLAEIAGYQYLLRQRLLYADIPFAVYPPTTIKKFVGSGRFKKEDMYTAFLTEDVKLAHRLNKVKCGLIKPIDDLIDAYFICKKLEFDLNQEDTVF